ncbi:hypothetical protein KQY27_07950 [Methanobrevibacter sp. TMH8]|uniref:hypothetical protein n=1 Tax=Methanobrevibacter sp. TMH8 TaxID=2848611 RepID=UPI001CCB2282|nr:hypothetical protein [Methanobrevibacter sp. TMH8]MBZ9571478.1 hypothetical protein [Methanobrevibacter sp. TMH8]
MGIIKYGVLGVLLIVIVLFGLNFITNEMNAVEDNFLGKITNFTGNEVENISGNITGTVYNYGNSKINYVKSQANVEPFIGEVKNNPNLTQISIPNAPKDSIAFKTSNGQYALLIIKPDKSEAVLIQSPNQKELVEAANKLNTGGEIIDQITAGLNNIKLDKSQINLDNIQI